VNRCNFISARAVSAVLALTIVFATAGCSFARSDGQTAAAAMSEVKSLPGTSSSTYVASDSSYSGFTKRNATTVSVNIDPDHHIQDPDALVDFLIRVAWSVNDAEPKGSSLMVAIDSDIPIDVVTAAQSAGWTGAGALNDRRDMVFIDLSDVEKRLGAWPGKVPAVPDGVIVTSTASPAP
jgi:hypothetical protein